MPETLTIPKGSKANIYQALLPQITALVANETDLVANLANIAAVLKEAFNFFWVGFYIKKDKQLVLGPFQGPLACTRINFDKGVCGHAYSTATTVIVPNVNAFPGHIACSSEAKSEIVIPVFDKNKQVAMVLDIDSDQLSHFNTTDQQYLEQLANIISKLCL
jgi:L-methionine (R)-S-oxide reductase